MNIAAPLLKTLEPLSRKSGSRIPHLAAHIKQRRAQSILRSQQQPRHNGFTTDETAHATARSASSIAFQDIQEVGTSEETDREGILARWATRASSVEAREVERADIDAERGEAMISGFSEMQKLVTMQNIVAEGHPERILHAFLHPQIGASFIQSASDDDFVQAFEKLDPVYFLRQCKLIDKAIHPKLYTIYKIRKAKFVGIKFDWCAKCLSEIITQRTASGHVISSSIYRHYMLWAEEMGDEILARDLRETMRRLDIQPDLPTYNSLMGATVWSGAYELDARYRRRNVPILKALRERKRRPARSQHTVELQRPLFERSKGETIRAHTLALFAELTQRGCVPDEVTFTNLMIGLGYDADMEGVKSILKSVWNIDIDMLAKYDEEEVESPTYYEDNHPLRPTDKLLHAVVYIFATNNDSYHASYLLDYVSRNYNIPIPDDVWMLLYETTYLLSKQFGTHEGLQQHGQDADEEVAVARRNREGRNAGALPHDSLSKLFQTMTDEPHNIEPNPWMLSKVANNARKALNSLPLTLDALRAAIHLRTEQLTLVSQLYDDVLIYLQHHWHHESPLLSAEFLDIRHDFCHESLKMDRDLEFLRMETQKTLALPYLFNFEFWKSDEWAVRVVPNLIQEFESYLPNTLDVEAPEYVYTIENAKWHAERAIHDSFAQLDVRAARLRNILEEEDPKKLAWKVKGLRTYLRYVESGCLVCKHIGEHQSEDCPRWPIGLAGHGLRYGREAVVFDELKTKVSLHQKDRHFSEDDDDHLISAGQGIDLEDASRSQNEIWLPPLEQDWEVKQPPNPKKYRGTQWWDQGD